MKKKVIWIVIAVALAAAGFYLYNNYRSASQAQAAQAAVETAKLETGSLSVTISAIGKVRANQSASLDWQTSGTVEEVSAVAGQPVKTGDILARLKQTSLPQSVILAQGDLASAQQSLDNLYTDANSAKVQAMADIVTYEQAVRDAQYQLDNFSVPSNMSGMDAVDGLAAMKVTLDAARTRFEPYKYLSSSDSGREDRLEDLNLAQADYNTAVKRLQYEYDLSVAQANLDKARHDYDQWENGPQPADVEAAKAKVAAAEATLSTAWIEAPFDGVITGVDPKTGDKVSANTAAFQIEDLTSLYVDLDVSEIDINQVAAGQPAALTFDAIRDKAYHGQVVEVGMTGVDSSGVVNYTVTVQVTDPDAAVRPGMTSEVEITVAQKDGVLLVPSQAITTENGEPVVYVLRPGQPRSAVPIQPGLANDTYTEVLSGDIKAGDEVVLNVVDASAADQNFRGPFMGPAGGGERRRVEDGEGQNGGQP